MSDYTTDPIFGCHLSVKRDSDGYGRTPDGKLAHRVAWEQEMGPIPPGMEIEHACRRRACRRVAHLELYTRSQQERAKAWSSRARKQTCKAGHRLELHAMVTPEGGRVCRTCSKGQ